MVLVLINYRQRVSDALESFLSEQKHHLAKSHICWADDVITKLIAYSKSAKMLRGSLCITVYELLAQPDEAIDQVASAVELLQSALIIQDDIMDKSDRRRGNPSVHCEYGQLAASKKATDHHHVGESLATCVADVALFLSFEQIASSGFSDSCTKQLISRFSQESTLTGLGQMHDVFIGAIPNQPVSLDDVFRIYSYKTARYTFVLPLTLALIAAQRTDMIDGIEQIGMQLGILFQIIDDKLCLIGDEHKTGKPIGTDIREGKATIYKALLMEHATGQRKKKLNAIFGNQQASQQDIKYVADSVGHLGIDVLVDTYIEDCKKVVNSTLQTLDAPEKIKTFFTQLMRYLETRES